MEIKIHSLLAGAKRAEGTAIVIDVLGAFTTAAYAFRQGADRLVLTPEADEALLIRKQGHGQICIGDVNGHAPEDFDVPNSPHAVSQLDLQDKAAILATRSGTVGANAAWHADAIYGAALVNAEATVQAVLAAKPKLVTVLAMGRDGRVRTDEDELAAVYLRNLLLGYRPDTEALTRLIRSCQGAQKYSDADQPQYDPRDLDLALEVNSLPFTIQIAPRNRMLVATPSRQPEASTQ